LSAQFYKQQRHITRMIIVTQDNQVLIVYITDGEHYQFVIFMSSKNIINDALRCIEIIYS